MHFTIALLALGTLVFSTANEMAAGVDLAVQEVENEKERGPVIIPVEATPTTSHPCPSQIQLQLEDEDKDGVEMEMEMETETVWVLERRKGGGGGKGGGKSGRGGGGGSSSGGLATADEIGIMGVVMITMIAVATVVVIQ